MDRKSSDLAPTFLAEVYERQIESISQTTKWLIGAFAAVGTIILGALKFSGIGGLTGIRLIAAIMLAFGSITLIAIAIMFCGRVIAAIRPGIAEVSDNPELKKKVEDGPVLLLSEYLDPKTNKRSVDWLKECYEEKIAAVHKSEEQIPQDYQDLERARRELDLCRLAEHEVLTFANFIIVKRRFELAQVVLGFCVYIVLALCILFSIVTTG